MYISWHSHWLSIFGTKQENVEWSTVTLQLPSRCRHNQSWSTTNKTLVIMPVKLLRSIYNFVWGMDYDVSKLFQYCHSCPSDGASVGTCSVQLKARIHEVFGRSRNSNRCWFSAKDPHGLHMRKHSFLRRAHDGEENMRHAVPRRSTRWNPIVKAW